MEGLLCAEAKQKGSGISVCNLEFCLDKLHPASLLPRPLPPSLIGWKTSYLYLPPRVFGVATATPVGHLLLWKFKAPAHFPPEGVILRQGAEVGPSPQPTETDLLVTQVFRRNAEQPPGSWHYWKCSGWDFATSTSKRMDNAGPKVWGSPISRCLRFTIGGWPSTLTRPSQKGPLSQ